MTATTTPPRRPEPGERRARQERLATWITLSVVLVICAAAGFGACAMALSWWVDEAPTPAAVDGMSATGRVSVDAAGRISLEDVFAR